MDGDRFDAVARAVGRRGALRLLLGGGLAAVLAGLGPEGATARRRRRRGTNSNTRSCSSSAHVTVTHSDSSSSVRVTVSNSDSSSSSSRVIDTGEVGDGGSGGFCREGSFACRCGPRHAAGACFSSGGRTCQCEGGACRSLDAPTETETSCCSCKPL